MIVRQDGNSIIIPFIVTGNPMATEVRWKKIENGVTAISKLFLNVKHP
jgi:hypothetical protein